MSPVDDSGPKLDTVPLTKAFAIRIGWLDTDPKHLSTEEYVKRITEEGGVPFSGFNEYDESVKLKQTEENR